MRRLLPLLLLGAAPGAGAVCMFDPSGEITNPFDPTCGGVILTYTENDTTGNNIALGYPVPMPVNSLTPVDGFRTYSSLHARHQDLMMSNAAVDGMIVGQTTSGRDIWAYQIGDADAVTADGFPEPAVLVNGGIHAREWQTPEVVTAVLEQMATQASDGGFGQYLIENLNTVLLPVNNVDGFIQTQMYPDEVTADEMQPREGRMRRKNLRDPNTGSFIDSDINTVNDNFWGVDLNRNNGVGFGQNNGSSSLLTSLIYRGSVAASEPEIQALLAAADRGPTDRLRLYSDTHSFTQIYFTPMTGNGRRDSLTTTLASRMRAVTGSKYRFNADPVGATIGVTADYFAYTFQIPAWTLETEPLNGGQDYGGTSTHGHSGFVLPDSEVARVRDELASTYLLGFFNQTGPPGVKAVQISETASGNVVYEASWEMSGPSSRALNVGTNTAMVPGSEYRLWLAFDKPMRWRDPATGNVSSYPGQLGVSETTGEATLEAPSLSGQDLSIPIGSGSVWLNTAGGAPNGYLRYADDALAVNVTVPAGMPVTAATPLVLSVTNQDLSQQQLDADPSTPVDWSGGHWSGYENALAQAGDSGGIDCSFKPFVAPMAAAAPPTGTATCAAAIPPPPPPPPPPPTTSGGGGGSTGLWLLAALVVPISRRI